MLCWTRMEATRETFPHPSRMANNGPTHRDRAELTVSQIHGAVQAKSVVFGELREKKSNPVGSMTAMHNNPATAYHRIANLRRAASRSFACGDPVSVPALVHSRWALSWLANCSST